MSGDSVKIKPERREPKVWEAWATIAFMLFSLIVLYVVVGIDLKISLMLVLVFNVFMAWRCHVPFKSLEEAICGRIGSMGFFMLVLLGIGFLVAGLMLSGTIPVLVAWLLQIVNPQIILLLCFVLTSILSIVLVSCFATVGSLGIIMFTVAYASGIPAGLAAAAVICGSAVGQYFSPFGDTTNLCAQVNDIDIMRMLKGFSVPFLISWVITAVYFYFMGRGYVTGAVGTEGADVIAWVSANFKMNILVLLPLVVAVVLALFRLHAIVVIYGTGLTGAVLGFTLQGFNFVDCVNALYNGFSSLVFFPEIENVPDIISSLLNRGGMVSMADGIVFFVIMLSCIAVFNAMGVFTVLKRILFKGGGNAGMLTLKASLAGWIFALIAAETYTVIMLTAEMCKEPLRKAGYAPTKCASIGMAVGNMMTYTAPWSFLAIYVGFMCGVTVMQFMGFALLFWLTPIVVIVLAFLGIGNKKLTPEEYAELEGVSVEEATAELAAGADSKAAKKAAEISEAAEDAAAEAAEEIKRE